MKKSWSYPRKPQPTNHGQLSGGGFHLISTNASSPSCLARCVVQRDTMSRQKRCGAPGLKLAPLAASAGKFWFLPYKRSLGRAYFYCYGNKA